jgi:FAD/FMN-containing dehydrogenase
MNKNKVSRSSRRVVLTLMLLSCVGKFPLASMEDRDKSALNRGSINTSNLVNTSRFLGKIISSAHDPQSLRSGIKGRHLVFYPKDEADVGRAVTRTLLEKWKTVIRSGVHVTKGDTVDGDGGAVINLKHLSEINIQGNEVEVQAGATVDEVFQQLAKHGLVLPLASNPLISIASNIFHENESFSPLIRSLGLLSNYVSKINAISADGKPVVFEGESSVSKCKESKAIMTRVKFKAKSAENLNMFCVSFLYQDQEHFLKVARFLFENNKRFSEADLMMDTSRGRYGIPLVKISAIQNLGQYSAKDAFDLGRIVESCSDSNVYSGSSVINAILKSEILHASSDPSINSERIHSGFRMDEKVNLHLNDYVASIHHAFSDSDAKRASRLQRNSNNDLELVEYIYTPIKVESLRMPVGTLLSRTSRPLALYASVPPVLNENKSPIDGFSGPIYQEGDREYNDRIEQYATTSFEKSLMSPFMVGYPVNKDDIVSAIKFAKVKGKKIVARSGGHQYTGKSSGGKDTIVLSMDNFNTLRYLGNDLVEVGPGVRLTDLASRFKEWKVTIPHGECPYVAIGGHAQTGGYGHLIRSFGLALDYVNSFDIVLADGSFRNIVRPNKAPVNNEEELDQKIFQGVLGGNAGSFGIITRYVFKGIKDSDHPKSYGFSKARFFNKDTFKDLMKEAQDWTKLIEDKKDDELLKGLDFMMSVESGSITSLWKPVMVVELVYADPNKNVPYSGQFESIIEKSKKNTSIFDKALSYFTYNEGEKKLSELSDSFVRRSLSSITSDGREFKYPYKKRVNVTVKALSDEFVNRFCAKIDDVVSKESDVKLVFQMAFGGGAFRVKGNDVNGIKVTSIPHRDGVYNFVFDLFYKPNGKQRAIDLQKEMQDIIDKCFHEESHERRVFWGTFENTDISNPDVRKMYYNNEEEYKKLQDLKKDIDPSDIFHTNLTVKLPEYK